MTPGLWVGSPLIRPVLSEPKEAGGELGKFSILSWGGELTFDQPSKLFKSVKSEIQSIKQTPRKKISDTTMDFTSSTFLRDQTTTDGTLVVIDDVLPPCAGITALGPKIFSFMAMYY